MEITTASSKAKRSATATLAPLWQHLSPKAKTKVRPTAAAVGATLVASASLPALVPGGASPEPSKSNASCSSPQAWQTAQLGSGSSVAAVRRLRASASSTQVRTSSAATSDNQSAQCMPCATDMRPAELETCPICLDDLSGRSLGVCLGSNGGRACQHYFHFDCLRRVEGARCPQCRVRFHKRAQLPSIVDDQESWYSHVSADGKEALSMREVATALKAMLLLSPDDVDELVEASWDSWTQGEDLLGPECLQELVAEVAEHIPAPKCNGCVSPQDATEEASAKLEDGHTRSGVVCSCGQVHVRRGDRVRRGPVPSEVDDGEIIPGHLGTIVHIGEGQESVTIKWDRSAGEKVHNYTWPDPDALVLAPALFGDVAEDVVRLQNETNLSAMAAEALLRRAGFDEYDAATLYAANSAEVWSEDRLRRPPKLYHRVRILPDKLLVQQWFDSVRPCQCANARCSGGVQWSSRADKHLGREGCVLKLDGADDTVLVETRGPCQCQIWYPRLALEQVYDPDLDETPEFTTSDRVECKMSSGWEKGVVNEVLWRGTERDGPCPYSVKLDNGSDILVPNVSLIRRVLIASE